MTKEEKKLVLQDLCARLPYHVMVHYHNQYNENGKEVVYDDDRVFEYFDAETIESDIDEPDMNYWPYDYWKPYLRPMSSMTEEEEKELKKIHSQFYKGNFIVDTGVFSADDGGCTVFEMSSILDYLRARNFDYNGLIEKGLAIEAPEGMYKI